MEVVAVAGGTGGVGKTIVEQLLAVQAYRVLVLSRSSPTGTNNSAVNQIQIAYNDISGMIKVLRDFNVLTVISTINIISEETSQSQLGLIKAAEQADNVRRFIPSEYGLVNTSKLLDLDPTVQFWIDAANALEKSRLKYTRFVNGFFMDYWGMPHIESHLSQFVWAIDMQNLKASIPGEGEDLVSFTYSKDVAKFIVKSLALDDWPEFSVIVGDEMTFNNMIALAEGVRGQKFRVHYENPDNFRSGNINILAAPGEEVDQESKELWMLLGLYTVSGILHMPTEKRKSELVAAVNPKSMLQLLNEAWNGK